MNLGVDRKAAQVDRLERLILGGVPLTTTGGERVDQADALSVDAHLGHALRERDDLNLGLPAVEVLLEGQPPDLEIEISAAEHPANGLEVLGRDVGHEMSCTSL